MNCVCQQRDTARQRHKGGLHDACHKETHKRNHQNSGRFFVLNDTAVYTTMCVAVSSVMVVRVTVSEPHSVPLLSNIMIQGIAQVAQHLVQVVFVASCGHTHL